MPRLEFKLEEASRSPALHTPRMTMLRFRAIPTNDAATALCDSKGGAPTSVGIVSDALADDAAAAPLIRRDAIHRICDLLDNATEADYVIT